MSKALSTEVPEDQRSHTGEQEQDTLGPLEDSEEKENSEPSVVELPSGISNTRHSKPSGAHEQESASNVAPDGNLAFQMEKDQPNLDELANVMKKVLDVLQDSTIASKTGKDDRSRFWGVYKRVAEEHDDEFLERYTGDMDIVLVFSGLFSAVSTSFIVAMESTLIPDPSDTTNALLTQLVQIGLGNFTAAGSTPVDPASTWSPHTSIVRTQMIAYASLSMSLLAAFGAVLGKQWLGYYKSNRYGRGSQEQRAKRRQEKFDGLVTWYFDAVVQSFPVLLQISLLLFGIALGANMWYEQPSIALVIIATTAFGFLFYSLTVMACLISPSCPFQTPMSTILRILHIDKVLLRIFEPASRYFQRLAMPMHGVLQRLFSFLGSSWARLSGAMTGLACATGAFARHSLQLLSMALQQGLRSVVPHSSTKVIDSEAQPLDQDLNVSVENDGTLTLFLKDIPTSNLEAPCIKWLLDTSTDPEVFLAATRLVPQVEWPLDIDISGILPHLYVTFYSCVDIQGHIVQSLEEKASACTMALSHLYHRRVLEAYPDHDNFICKDIGYRDFEVFQRIISLYTAKHTMLSTAMNICVLEDAPKWSLSWLDMCPVSVLEWLSHVLPYHFFTGPVDESGGKFASEVISKLLSSPSSPSTQIIANCTLLACIMVGVQVDRKDIIRIDKSNALPRLGDSLLEHFQKAFLACNGGELDKDSTGVVRRAWDLLDVICRVLELADPHFMSYEFIRNLDVCKKIYLRARSSEKNDAFVLFAALRNAMDFTFAAAYISHDPVNMWYISGLYPQSGDLPKDFDWLVDYLDYIYSDDHQVVYDILLLLSSMEVCYSPDRQQVLVERLIACMDSNMPHHLRHVALRAAHSSREAIASIDVMNDAKLGDMLSSAILSVVCPLPGTTPAGDGSYRFFYRDRDSCYLRLVFALAKNVNWHPHLCRDHHIDRCISMISKDYDPELPPTEDAFYIACILLQLSPEQRSVTSFDSVTEQQWWDLMRGAWSNLPCDISKSCYFKHLFDLVDGTKKYMHQASKSDLEHLICAVAGVIGILEIQLEMGPEMGQKEGGLEQIEEIITATKELKTTAGNKLESIGEQL